MLQYEIEEKYMQSNSIQSHPLESLALRLQWHTGMCHCMPPHELTQTCVKGTGKTETEAVGDFVLNNPTMFGYYKIELHQGPALQA